MHNAPPCFYFYQIRPARTANYLRKLVFYHKEPVVFCYSFLFIFILCLIESLFQNLSSSQGCAAFYEILFLLSPPPCLGHFDCAPFNRIRRDAFKSRCWWCSWRISRAASSSRIVNAPAVSLVVDITHTTLFPSNAFWEYSAELSSRTEY